jgi:hypothetical protein
LEHQVERLAHGLTAMLSGAEQSLEHISS